MSDLQLALLGIGVVVIAGVVGYNALQERRARARAEKAFGAAPPDVLFDAPGERREPRLGNLDAADAPPAADDAAPVPRAAPDEAALDTPVGDAPGPIVSERIDTIAVILADDPVTREQLGPFLDALQDHTTPVNVEGIENEQWLPLEESTRGSWREIRAGLQLASRSGPVNEEEIASFNARVAEFAASVNAVSQREAPAVAAQRAMELDRFCAEADIEVALNVVGQFGATFAMARVKQIALEHGLSETGSGALVAFGRDGHPEFVVRHFDRAGSQSDSSYATGLTLALDVPHVAESTAAFAEMVQLAEAYVAALGGELVDDNRKPLTAAGLAAIGRSVEEVARAMQASGIPAGGALARRLFA